MVYHLTDEDYPDPPQSIEVEKTNYSSLSVSWLPPKSPNGIIDHYDIVFQYKKINVSFRTHIHTFFLTDSFMPSILSADRPPYLWT